MPVTRSRSSSLSTSIISSKSVTKPSMPKAKSTTEVILLSDDEGPKRKKAAKRHRRQQAKPSKPKHSFVLEDVLEISSDDEPRPLPPCITAKPPEHSITISNLQGQVQALQTEIAQLQQECRSLKEKPQLDLATLEDSISCDVCTLMLWSPYILPGCGHTFCESCLKDWFEKALHQHLRTYPHYDVNANANQDGNPAASRLDYYDNTGIRRYLGQQPQPEYTCPSCRTQVKSRPVEEFTLKAMIRTVAAAKGECSPKKPVVIGGFGVGRSGPWDRYFGKVTRIPSH